MLKGSKRSFVFLVVLVVGVESSSKNVTNRTENDPKTIVPNGTKNVTK